MKRKEEAPVISSERLRDGRRSVASRNTAVKDTIPKITSLGSRRRLFPVALWIMASVAVIVWSHFDRPGWDVSVTYKAMSEVQEGRDPYADGVAELAQYRNELRHNTKVEPPFIYVYPPITLPVLRIVGKLPAWLSHSLYWIAYILSTFALIWAGMRFVELDERVYFNYLAPVAVFFPGLLANGTVLSGNIAIILYAAIFLAALHGWSHGRWRCLYLVALAAACVKGPFLLFAAVPVLSEKRQWLKAGGTVAAGLALVELQSLLWPTLFKHYLESVGLMFGLSHDFGCSPAGLLGDLLASRGLPFAHATTISYASYAVTIFAVLFYLSRRFLRGEIPLTRWAPILMTGMALMNPRLIEYDVAPVTIPVALILWRFMAPPVLPRLIAFVSIFLCLTNCIGLYSWELRKWMDGPLLVFIFTVGCWPLVAGRRLGQFGKQQPAQQVV